MRPLLALLVATGCGTSITSTMIDQSPKPIAPRSPASVAVFPSGPPARPHVAIAYLEAEQQTDMSIDGTDAFIAKLRVRAAAIGCDGVVLGAETNRTDTSTADLAHDVVEILGNKPVEPPADYGTPANLRGLTATCIVYVPEPGEIEAASAVAESMHAACKRQRSAMLLAVQREATAGARAHLIRSVPACESPAVLTAKQLR